MNKILITLALFILISAHSLSEEELNQQIISEDMINFINSSNASFTAGVNPKFANATKKDVISLLGKKYLINKDELPIVSYGEDILKNLPEEYDARITHSVCASIIGHIQDQASCGSCWANSAAGVIGDRMCIKSNGLFKKLISAADIMSCCHVCGSGCNGGDEAIAFVQWFVLGYVTGGDFGDKDTCKPYPFPKCDHHVIGKYPPCSGDDKTPSCKHECQPSYQTHYKDDKHRGTAYQVSHNETQIMADIFENGPVTSAFNVYEDFPLYKSGVYHHVSGKYLGNHAVRIIGWGIENGIKYWLVANSWNEDWGMSGLFKIKKGSNEVGFESHIAAGKPILKEESLNFLE